jgi:hypothetical protein
MKTLKFIAYLIIVSLIILLFIEVFSRFILPISIGAKKVDKDNNLLNHHYNKKNSSYYLSHPEYFVLTNIDSNGNRVVPASTDSDKLLIFIGDSHMFGQGVNDLNTIPNLICNQILVECINLASPGTGTLNQSKILKAYIKKNKKKYKIIKVVHLIFASSIYNYSGNDLTDNLIEFDYLHKKVIIYSQKNKIKNFNKVNKFEIPVLPDEVFNKPLDEIKDFLDFKKIQEFEEESNYNIKFEDIILSTIKFFYINSNIARVIGHFYGLDIRASIYSKYPSLVNKRQLIIFNNTINAIKKDLSDKNIQYYPFLHSSYAEIKNGWNYKTYEELSPMFETLYMPEYNLNKVKDLYFKGDGHNNISGNKKISSFIIKILNNTLDEKN